VAKDCRLWPEPPKEAALKAFKKMNDAKGGAKKSQKKAKGEKEK